jgi:hypothetical protein
VLLTAATVAAVAYCSFQWTVQLVIYRMFGHVPATAFPAYEAAHQRCVSLMVGPLFAALVLSTGALAVRPGAVDTAVTAGAAGGTVVLLGLIAFGAVPLHQRLARRYDAMDVRRLLRIDLARALVASAQSGLLVAALLRAAPLE